MKPGRSIDRTLFCWSHETETAHIPMIRRKSPSSSSRTRGHILPSHQTSTQFVFAVRLEYRPWPWFKLLGEANTLIQVLYIL